MLLNAISRLVPVRDGDTLQPLNDQDRQTHPYGAASCRDGGKSDAYLGYDGKNAAYPS